MIKKTKNKFVSQARNAKRLGRNKVKTPNGSHRLKRISITHSHLMLDDEHQSPLYSSNARLADADPAHSLQPPLTSAQAAPRSCRAARDDPGLESHYCDRNKAMTSETSRMHCAHTISSTFERCMQNPFISVDEHSTGRGSKVRLTGVTHSLQLQQTPAQSKFPSFAPHFLLGHTIFPASCPSCKNGSIHFIFIAAHQFV